MFRSLFHDHLQWSSFVLSAFTTFQLPASSFVIFGYVAVCHLFVCVRCTCLCAVWSCFARPDSTQTSTPDTQILKGLNYEMATISDVRKLFYTTLDYLAKNVSLISTLHIWSSRIHSSDNGVITHAVLSAGNMCLIHYLRRIQNLWLSFPLNNTKCLYALLFQERAQSVKRCLLRQHCLKHTSSHFNFFVPLV
jgi:hypothetical protein